MLEGIQSTLVFIQSAPSNVLHHHSKHLMGYFEFLHVSRIICLPLNISEKLRWQYVLEKLEKAETHCLSLRSNIYHSNIKRTTIIFSYGSQSRNYPRSDPFCWQCPCSSSSGIDLVVVLEDTFFLTCSNSEKIS